MRIRRSTSAISFFEAGITDRHIQAAITDPEAVVLECEGDVYRVVGLSHPLEHSRWHVSTASLRIQDPSLLEIVYQDCGDEALVTFAKEADEEAMREWRMN
jgi:hypothetical protein